MSATDIGERQRTGARIDADTVERALSELGVFGAVEDGLSMTTAQIQSIVAREAGAAALPFPVLESLAVHSVVLRAGPVGEATGARSITLPGSYPCKKSALPILRDGRLSGEVKLVPFAERAQRIVVAARRDDKVVLAEVALPELAVQRAGRASVEPDYPLQDLKFQEAPVVATITHLADGANAMDFLSERVSLLAAAEIAGACRRMVLMTRDYLLARTQFGQPLGANQALKHALADAFTRVEALVAAIEYAAAAADAQAADAKMAICVAKQFASRFGKAVAESMLQMHGAIGYTVEYPLHLLMRRVYRLSATYGSSHWQSEKLFQMFRQSA